jgi:putative PIN family toxin of toxin-antitoxin system
MQESKIIKIVIDTNVLISFLIGKTLKGLQNYIDDRSIQIYTCIEQIEELLEVFNKPKIKKYINSEHSFEFIELLTEKAILEKIDNIIPFCRDPKDDYLITLALQADCNYLVTGDDDLLSLSKIDRLQIITFSDFKLIVK